MEKQRIRIKKYDWLVDIFYFPSKNDIPCIMNEMFINGASYDSLDNVACQLCQRNNGCAYTNPYSRYTILVIGKVTSIGQFFDTLVHELNHLCSAIEKAYGIDPHGEEASYLMGDVAMQIIEDKTF